MNELSAVGAATRRRFSRREDDLAPLSGYLAVSDGSTGDARLLDLSYDGCKIATDLGLSAGQSVKLAVRGRPAIDCEVRWFEGGKAGLKFAAPPSGMEERRRRLSERTPLSAQVNIRRLGRSKFRTQMVDLSPEGCRFEFVDRPRVDETVSVRIDGLEPLHAKVCWVEGPWAGVRFRRPIHLAVFDLILSEAS